MEAQELQVLLRDCPLLIRMADGRQYYIETPEFIVVADYTAAVLAEENGVKRIHALTLMNIASVVTNAAKAGA